MRHLVKYIIGLLLLTVMVGCYSVEIEQVDDVRRVPVVFSTAVPVPEIPTTRAISNDSEIQQFVIWVFSDNKFVEAIYSDETYTEGDAEYPMARLDKDGDLFLMLQEGMTKVTLAMAANVSDIQEPTIGQSREEANALFQYDNPAMPMYGINNKEITVVSPGVDGGVIILRRAMARIEIDAIKAEDHFVLQNIYMYYPNEEGTIRESSIVNATNTATLKGTVIQDDNRGYIYIPEVDLSAQTTYKSCLILEGLYKGKKTYYKLDFICQDNSSGDITYYSLGELSRNYRYIFDIQYLTEGTGYTSVNEAIANPASNRVPEGNIQLIKVYDTEIKDITTNNYIYLGVTSSELQTAPGNSYHVANLSIVTNCSKGWQFEQPLPDGVYLSIEKYVPKGGAEVVSVWIYLDKNKFRSGSSVTIYVYGENIRKSITIRVP